jgi:hypothetical protein
MVPANMVFDMTALSFMPRCRFIRTFGPRGLARAGAIAGLALGFTGSAVPHANARVHFGIGIGIPLYGPPAYYPPPVYYPPPIYYPPPPPVYYVPPPPVNYASPGHPAGQFCYAAQGYTCPMERPIAAGAACYCPGNQGERIPGHTN